MPLFCFLSFSQITSFSFFQLFFFVEIRVNQSPIPEDKFELTDIKVTGVFFDLSLRTIICSDRTTNVQWLHLALTKVAKSFSHNF